MTALVFFVYQHRMLECSYTVMWSIYAENMAYKNTALHAGRFNRSEMLILGQHTVSCWRKNSASGMAQRVRGLVLLS